MRVLSRLRLALSGPHPSLVTGDHWDGSGPWSWIGRNVVIRAQYPITLQLNGRDRPIDLPAVVVEISDSEKSTSYVVSREMTLTPANTPRQKISGYDHYHVCPRHNAAQWGQKGSYLSDQERG